MSEKKEKIAVLIVLLFILSYLIIWDYDKMIREPREMAEKERQELWDIQEKEGYLYLDKSASEGTITFTLDEEIDFDTAIYGISKADSIITSVAISHEELETLTSVSSEIYLDCTPTAQVIEQVETIAYHIMPKSLDLLIKDFISFKQDKEEIYRLIWKWMGYDYVEDVNMIVISPLHPLYQDDFVAMRSVKDFIEWLYENNYEIVKKEDK